MNPRHFCRDPGYETALCLTYAFDPIFFERLILPDLWAGGAGEVLVVGDQGRITEMLMRAHGRLQHLGRRYQLGTVVNCAAQHAKLILRLGEKGARLWVGSNNLTAAGWGGPGENEELAAAWQIDPNDRVGAGIVKRLLQWLAQLAVQGFSGPISALQDLPWIEGADPTRSYEDRAVLLPSPGQPLAAELGTRWSDRRFSRLLMLTGSTDQSGAFLGWVVKHFGVSEILVGLRPGDSSFLPSRLKRLPARVRIVPLASQPRKHSKFVWLEGRKGSAAVVGSANCSARAWLAPPDQGGNLEAVVAFDRPKEKEFEHVLKIFEENNHVDPDDVLNKVAKLEPEEPPVAPRATFRLCEFSSDLMLGQLAAVIAPAARSAHKAEAEIDDHRTPMVCADADGSRWLGPAPDLAPGIGTHFGRLHIHFAGTVRLTDLRWLDEHDELRHARQGRRITDVLPQLAHPPSKPSAQKALIEEIAAIAHSILSEQRFPDPIMSHPHAPQEPKEEVVPVDPDELVVKLADLPACNVSHARTSISPGLSLLGVMRVLFPMEEEENANETSDDEESNDREPSPKRAAPKEQDTERPTQAASRKLIAEMDRFLSRLAEEDFAARCTATQLVQATAFPLAVAAKALQGHWVEPRTAADWVFKTTDLLLRVKTKLAAVNEPCAGLLGAVERRYTSDGREAVLKAVVGNGLLWVAITQALSALDTDGTTWRLERAVALRDVFERALLRIHVAPQRLARLLSGTWDWKSRSRLLKEAQEATKAIRQLEHLLTARFDALLEKQKSASHQADDPLWRPAVGFAWARESADIEYGNLSVYSRLWGEERTVKAAFYLNLRLASASDPAIAALLKRLGWASKAEPAAFHA